MAVSTTALNDAASLDEYYTKDIVTIYGSVVAKNNVPEKVAFVVAKLKEAGAVVLGETTAAEWSSNNLEHDVGALSGGSGAALGANFAVLADTPGPMVRTVTGCALMLDCMVGFDPGNDFTGFAATAAAIGLPRGGSYAAHLEDRPPKIKKANIGIVRHRLDRDSEPYCKAVNTLLSSAKEKLRTAGTEFVDVHIDNLDGSQDLPPALPCKHQRFPGREIAPTPGSRRHPDREDRGKVIS
ncbi:putative amidase [Seiridium unicorne]|uniref:Amidase n=1 Tax=Seiridium unicorne TaxID=138068 RepID=A0ABR2UPL5_9PEZI